VRSAVQQGVDRGLGDLLVLVRLHAGDADPADAFPLDDDRQPAVTGRTGIFRIAIRPRE